MAGAGAKLFNSGDVLTAAQVNTYLMDQAVMRFATSTDRDNAFGGAGEPTLAEGMVCYLQDNNLVQVYDGTTWITIADVNYSKDGLANVITNGGMSVWQRGTATVNLGAGTRVALNCDRWFGVGSSANQSVTQSATAPSFSQSAYSLQLNGGAGGTTCAISQRIESINVNMVRGNAVFSCSVFNSTGAAFTPTLQVYTPATTSVDTWTTPTLRTTLTAQQSCTNGAWTTVTFAPTDFSSLTNGVYGIQFDLVCTGLGTGSLVRVCDVQCTRGNAASPFLSPDFGTVLAQCQRYYETSYPYGTAVGTVTTSGLVDMTGSSGDAASGPAIITTVRYQVAKRAAGTVTVYGGIGGGANNVSVMSSAVANVDTSATTGNQTEYSFRAFNTAGGLTAWASARIRFHWACNAEL